MCWAITYLFRKCQRKTAQSSLFTDWLVNCSECAPHTDASESKSMCIDACSLNYRRIEQFFFLFNASKKRHENPCRHLPDWNTFDSIYCKSRNGKKFYILVKMVGQLWMLWQRDRSNERMSERNDEQRRLQSIFIYAYVRLNRVVCHCLDISVQQRPWWTKQACMRAAHSIRGDS